MSVNAEELKRVLSEAILDDPFLSSCEQRAELLEALGLNESESRRLCSVTPWSGLMKLVQLLDDPDVCTFLLARALRSSGGDE